MILVSSQTIRVGFPEKCHSQSQGNELFPSLKEFSTSGTRSRLNGSHRGLQSMNTVSPKLACQLSDASFACEGPKDAGNLSPVSRASTREASSIELS